MSLSFMTSEFSIVPLLSLQLPDLVQGQLQLSLNLPPLLLEVTTRSLLLVHRGLDVVQSALQLILHGGEVGHLVLGGLKILGALRLTLIDVLFLLVQLVDDLVLLGNLVIEGAD